MENENEIKIHGKYHPVKLKVEVLSGLSIHADQKELLDWLTDISLSSEKIYIVYGEKQAAETFLVRIKDTYGWKATVPAFYQIDEIYV